LSQLALLGMTLISTLRWIFVHLYLSMVLVALGIVLNGRMGNELITRKDVERNVQQQEFPTVVQFDAPSWHLPGGTEENYKQPQF
jgi:hypothetical protein